MPLHKSLAYSLFKYYLEILIPMTLQTLEKEEALPVLNEGYRSVFQNRNFLMLWIGQVFSQLGDRVVFVVFIAAITANYGVNDSYNSYLYVAFTIPAILLTAIAGVFVDRWPRRLVLVLTNVFRAIFVAFLPWAVEHSLMGIYVVAFLLSAATQFFVPAEGATIPMIVRKTQLMAANSLFTTTMMASVIFGFALGDPLINIFGMESVHWFIVGLFVLASVMLCFVKAPKPAKILKPDDSEASQERVGVGSAIQDFFDELRDGIDYIRQDPLIWRAMLKLAMLFSAVVAMCILFISFARDYLYEDPEVAARKFAYIVTYSGVGMALGALVVGRFFRDTRRSYLVFSGFLLVGTCICALAFVDQIPQGLNGIDLPQHLFQFASFEFFMDRFQITYRMIVAYVLAVVMGAGVASVAIPLQALLHEIIPEDKRGKIMGVQFTILSTSSTLPVLAAGWGVEYVGTYLMLILIGVPLGFIGIYGLYRRLFVSHAITKNW